MMISRLARLLGKAKHIFQAEGLIPLLRRGFAFPVSSFRQVGRLFQHETFYLYESHPSEALKGKTEADLIPKIQNLTFHRISSNQEADELEAEGLEFRSQVFKAREKLDKGAIASCIFVGKELASVGWVAMDEEAKKMVDPYPYKVDFANYESCGGGAWTNPKYRRMGLHAYSIFKRYQFVNKKGIITTRSAIAASNIASQRSMAKLGYRLYAEGRYLKILWWKFWKEKPMT